MAESELVVVTGATGFVGKWTVIAALREGFRVRGTVRALSRGEPVRAAVSAALGPEALLRLKLVEADLLEDRGWAEAMAGANAVLHTATVIMGDEPKDSSLVIRPAVEGTARVLSFAHAAGIRRVVITSSIATVGYGHGQTGGSRTYTEADLTNIEGMRWSWAYCIGKTRAEQAAWAFAKDKGMALTTIHPGMILGPATDSVAGISIGAVTGLLDGTTPALPNMGFSVIDVRDVADMHVAALQKPRAIGQRYLATARYLWFHEISEILQKAYPDRKVTIKLIPDWLLGLMVYFYRPIRQIINDVGMEKHFDGSKGEQLLGRPYRTAEEAVLASAETGIRFGLLKPKK